MPSAQGHITIRRRAKNGDDGAPALVFELMPSVSSVKQTGSVFTPSSLTCSVKRTQGSAYSILSTAAALSSEGLTLQYCFDSGSYLGIDPASQVVPTVGLNIIRFRAIKDSMVVASASVAVIADGANGNNGVAGQIIRQVKWMPGQTYHNDDVAVPALRYLDILLIFNSAGALSGRYMCTGTYTAGESEVAPSGAGNTHWTQINTMSALYTPVLMSDMGEIVFLQSNRIVIQKADGTVTAGLSGAGSGATGYRIWAGGADPATAPFRVNEIGRVIAEDAEISGKIVAEDGGQIGSLIISGGGLRNDAATDNYAGVFLSNASGTKLAAIGTQAVSVTTGLITTAVFQNEHYANSDIYAANFYAKNTGSGRGVALGVNGDIVLKRGRIYAPGNILPSENKYNMPDYNQNLPSRYFDYNINDYVYYYEFKGHLKTADRTYYLPRASDYKQGEEITFKNWNVHNSALKPLGTDATHPNPDTINGFNNTQKWLTLGEPWSTVRLMSGGTSDWEIVWISVNVDF